MPQSSGSGQTQELITSADTQKDTPKLADPWPITNHLPANRKSRRPDRDTSQKEYLLSKRHCHTFVLSCCGGPHLRSQYIFQVRTVGNSNHPPQTPRCTVCSHCSCCGHAPGQQKNKPNRSQTRTVKNYQTQTSSIEAKSSHRHVQDSPNTVY